MFADDRTGPEDVFVQREATEGVRDAIESLGEDFRRIVELVYFKEQTLTEAAKTLGWTFITTRRRHAEALRRLMPKLRGAQAVR